MSVAVNPTVACGCGRVLEKRRSGRLSGGSGRADDGCEKVCINLKNVFENIINQILIEIVLNLKNSKTNNQPILSSSSLMNWQPLDGVVELEQSVHTGLSPG